MKNDISKNRNRDGFTLSEVLVTVLILIILFALAVPAIFTIRRNLKQTELDRKAEIIYTAVQDRLSELYTKGNSDVYDPSIHSDIKELPTEPFDYDYDALDGKTQSIYYVLDNSEVADLIVTDDVLSDDVKDGYWVVEIIPYAAKENDSDQNVITSGLVYGVYYSEEVDISSPGTSDDCKHYVVNGETSDMFLNNLRVKDYRKNKNYGDAKIGYYGGSNATSGTETSNLSITDIRINSNEEVNTAVVKVKTPLGSKNGLKFTFTLTDDYGHSYDMVYNGTWTTQSGKKTLPAAVQNCIEVKNVGVNYTFTFTLDDLTSENTRFDSVFGSENSDAQLVVGSNIQLKAYVECEVDLRVKTDEKSCEGNSIFGYDDEDDNDEYYVISNGRHLQNLDEDSGLEDSIKNNKGMTSVAKIMNDIDFSESGTFYEEYNDKYFNGVTSYQKVNSSNTSKFVNFKSIINDQLTELTSDKQYKLINFSTSGNGLFDEVGNTLEISNIDLTGERVFYTSNDKNVGGLVGTVLDSGTVTIDHVQSYLDTSDIPSTITSDMNIESYRWIQGHTVGGLVGSNRGSLNITNSSVSTVIGNSTSITGGLVGFYGSQGGSTSNLSLNISNSYADNYLYGYDVGGLVGTATRSVNSISSSYVAGFIGLDKNENAQGAGLVVGNVSSAKNSYTILTAYNVADDNGLEIGGELGTDLKGSYNSTFSSGSVSNVYYLRGSVKGTNISGTSVVDSTMSLGSSFITSGKKVTKYQLLGRNLSNYEYPILKSLSHYGDWTAEFESGALVYYEEYSNGTFGFEGANLEVSLIGNKDIVGDGYGVLYKANDVNNPTSVKVTVGSEVQTITLGSGYKSVTVDGVEYHIYPLNKTIMNPTSSIDGFYERATLEANSQKKLYDFNPHFARSVVDIQDESEVTPTPTNVSIRSPRHLYNLSLYYDSGYRNMENVTYTQERNMIYSSYHWTDYTNETSVITKQSPIGSDEEHSFKDTYNGGSYEIGDIGFSTVSGNYVGMFGYSTGTIKNVVLATQYSTSSTSFHVQRTKAVQANETVYYGILAGKNSGSISNSAVAGYYLSGSDGTIHGYANSTIYVGGLVGYNDGTITDSEADSPKLSLSMHRATCYAGGFVGYNEGNITNSYGLNHITSDVSDGKTMIAGFVAYNTGSINQSYCATALTSQGSGSYAYAFGSTDGGGSCRESYYLYRGSYQFVDGLYAYDRNDSSSIGSYKTYLQLQSQRGTSVAQTSLYHDLTTALDSDETVYPYRAVVKDSNGNYVHYGEWQVKPSLGISGVFYWEHEENGQNNGYKITYIGSENGTVKYQSTVCDSHDDGGVITEFGYGYYVGEDYVDEVTCTTNNAISMSDNNNVNKNAKTALESQIPGIKFYPHTTNVSDSGDYIYLANDSANGMIALSDSVQTYTYTISPFFANALSMTTDLSTTDTAAQQFINTTPGLEENPYEIRSASQLQYINWNSGTKSTDSLVTSSNYTTYNYLMNCGSHTSSGNTVTKDNAGNNDRSNFVFQQSHDLNAESIDNFVPIAGQGPGTSTTTGYTATLYAWFGGTFDGQSYKIQELNINSKAFSVGLFGTTAGAKIENVILYSTKGATIQRNTENTDEQGAYSLGGLIGVAYDYKTSTNRPVTNCAIAGYNIIDNSKNQQGLGEANVGGLIGVANVNVEKCSSVVDIQINATHKNSSGRFTKAQWGNYIRVGGITGAVQNAVTNCYSGGSISVGDETLDETYNSSTHVSQTSSSQANKNDSTNVYLSGIAGGAFTMNYQNFTGSTSSYDGKPTVTNCYTYITFPAMEGTIRNITMFACVADRFEYASSVVTNCYYLSTSADIDTSNLPSYYFSSSSASVKSCMTTTYKDNMIKGSAKWMYKMYNNNSSGSDQGTFTKVSSKTYEELEDPSMNDLLGDAFTNVSDTDTYGQSVDGKYSFNAGTSALDGKNYPFPTVVTQDNESIHVHYGSWPFSGCYWEKGVDTLDIFDSMDSDSYAYKTVKLMRNKDKDVSVSNLNISVDKTTPYVEVVDGSLQEDEDGNFTVQLKALKTGTARITATWIDENKEEQSADFLLTVTANLNASADPSEMTLENNEQKTSTLKVVSDAGIDYSTKVKWTADPSTKFDKDGDVGTSVSSNKVTITGYNLNAEVYAVATYDYHGESYTARTVITVKKVGVVGLAGKNGNTFIYNEGKYTPNEGEVTGTDTTYSKAHAPSNTSENFLYEVNANSILEDANTTYSAVFTDNNGNELTDIYMSEINKNDVTSNTNTNDFKTIPVHYYFNSSNQTETRTVNVTLTVTNGNTSYILTINGATATANPFQLTADANGGKYSDNSTTKTQDITTDIDLSTLEQPTKTGYTFNGWKDGEGNTVEKIEKNTLTGNVTVYANWTAKTKDIVFDPQNGSASTTVNVAYDSTTVGITAPTRNTFVFDGWYTDTNYTTQVIDKDGNVVNKDALNERVLSNTTQTLYAKWKKQFSLVYDLGSNHTLDGITKVNGDSVDTCYPSDYVYGSYVFQGWYYWNDSEGNDVVRVMDASGNPLNPTIDGVMTNGVFNVSDTTDTVTLHAKWSTTSSVTGYFQVDSLSSNGSYVIVNSDNTQALTNNNGSVGSTSITVMDGDTPYISNAVDSSAVWTYSNNKLTNSNRNLYVSSRRTGWSYTYSLSLSSNSSSSWSYSNNELTTSISSGWWDTTVYLTYNNGFSVSTDSSNVNLYQLDTRDITHDTWEYEPKQDNGNASSMDGVGGDFEEVGDASNDVGNNTTPSTNTNTVESVSVNDQTTSTQLETNTQQEPSESETNKEENQSEEETNE